GATAHVYQARRGWCSRTCRLVSQDAKCGDGTNTLVPSSKSCANHCRGSLSKIRLARALAGVKQLELWEDQSRLASLAEVVVITHGQLDRAQIKIDRAHQILQWLDEPLHWRNERKF